MVKKWISVIVLFVFLNFSWFRILGQDLKQSSLVFSGVAINQENDNSNKIKVTGFIIPGTFLAYGALKPVITGIQQLDDNIMLRVKENHPSFHTHTDDYLMWVPSASIYVADALNIKSKHSFGEHLLLDAGSIIVTGSIGYAMRKIVGNNKTYNSHDTKFPSGHTANAFRGAEIIHQEFKEKNNLLSYSGYVVATAVGVLRIYNKNHLLTEVLAGAGLGILSTKLTYWVFYKFKDRKNRSVGFSLASLNGVP